MAKLTTAQKIALAETEKEEAANNLRSLRTQKRNEDRVLERKKRDKERVREQRRIQIIGQYIIQAARQDDEFGEKLRRCIENYVAGNVPDPKDVDLMKVIFTLPVPELNEEKPTGSDEEETDGSKEDAKASGDDAQDDISPPGADVKNGEPDREKNASGELPETEAKFEDVGAEGDANVSSESVSTSTTDPANDQEGVSDIADEQTDSDPENIDGDADQEAPSGEPEESPPEQKISGSRALRA